jgi:fructose-1-phosphate kinase PfkB-like protein
VPASFYGKLIALARQRKVKSLLDADGDPLREGIEAKPSVVTPNQQEAERLLGRTLLTRTHCLDALRAAYTWAMERKSNPADALRWGVAAGTASARLPGTAFANLAQTQEIYRHVEVRRVE